MNKIKQQSFVNQENNTSIQSLNNEVELNQDRILLLNKEINKLNNEMTIKNNNLSDCNAVINQLRNDQVQREEQIKKLNENIFDMEREIKSL